MRKSREGPRDWNQARTELTRERAASAKLARLEKQGQLLPVRELIAMNTAIATTVRNRMLAIGSKLAPRLLGIRNAEAQAIILAEVTEVLTGLANLEVTLAPPSAAA